MINVEVLFTCRLDAETYYKSIHIDLRSSLRDASLKKYISIAIFIMCYSRYGFFKMKINLRNADVRLIFERNILYEPFHRNYIDASRAMRDLLAPMLHFDWAALRIIIFITCLLF